MEATISQVNSYTSRNNIESQVGFVSEPNDIVEYALALLDHNGVSLTDPRVSKLLGLANQLDDSGLHENLTSLETGEDMSGVYNVDSCSEPLLSSSQTTTTDPERMDGRQLQKLRAQIQTYRLLRQNKPISTSLLLLSAGEFEKRNYEQAENQLSQETESADGISAVSRSKAVLSSASTAAKLFSNHEDSSTSWEGEYEEHTSYSNLMEKRERLLENRIERQQ
ncbi:Transcription regulatory protein SNF2 [Galdieria sulphuraria]|nr:Transcription regulatory protein SNF2 [Galdieria sulphuraria]